MKCSCTSRHLSPLLALALVACGSTASAPGDAAADEPPDAAPSLLMDAAPAKEANPVAPDVPAAVVAPDEAPSPPDTGPAPPPDAAAAAGEFSATLNASTPYHVGSEHVGYTMFGTVVDTTAGADRARVGAIQSTVVAKDTLVKWVWPAILVKGHTYELAVFEDHLKNRTCMGSATAEPQWLFKIPAVAGDYEFKWVQPVPHTASCQDFPAGPIP